MEALLLQLHGLPMDFDVTSFPSVFICSPFECQMNKNYIFFVVVRTSKSKMPNTVELGLRHALSSCTASYSIIASQYWITFLLKSDSLLIYIKNKTE